MRKVLSAIIALVIVALMAFGYYRAASHHHGSGEVNPKEIIYEHLGDAYGWEIPFAHDVRIPLPVIVKGNDGWHCFMSNKVTGGETYEGFKIDHGGEHNGKIVQIVDGGKEVRPLDFSITKNVAAIFVAALIVILMVFSIRNWYKKHGMKAPRKGTAFLELIVDYVYYDTIRPIMGKDAPKYAPYLLTVFFFILTMNLMGLIVIFPGGANLTGNLAVTMVLALITFFIINLTGTKEYWKEILWPDVPMALKCPVPMMPFIEILGMFTKPIALMIRLFANMMGGHMVVLVLMLLIFIFTSMFGAIVGGATTVFSLAFALFMLALDTLVSFIQAYVFTILSTIFISMSHVEPHHHE
ncbi:MAG: F0F1 ATP synthase subunit A [Muribaculaceae bacterium]|nr:F0F1 ATP synthase subunit A [Muribaculaceae bacterium]